MANIKDNLVKLEAEQGKVVTDVYGHGANGGERSARVAVRRRTGARVGMPTFAWCGSHACTRLRLLATHALSLVTDAQIIRRTISRSLQTEPTPSQHKSGMRSRKWMLSSSRRPRRSRNQCRGAACRPTLRRPRLPAAGDAREQAGQRVCLN